jgi:hypothetical protein
MPEPLNPRRVAFGAARKLIFDDRDPQQMLEELAGLRPSSNPNEPRQNMSRPRRDILGNLDEMYREAFERAKATGDEAQLVDPSISRIAASSCISRFFSTSAKRSNEGSRFPLIVPDGLR